MKRADALVQHKIDTVLDELDRKILYQWDLDARQSAQDIAKSIGSNKDTVAFRMKRLMEDGIVTSSITEIDTAKLGYNNIKVYLQFQNFSKEVEKEFFGYLSSIKNVGWIVSCSGRWDALFCCWAPSPYEFYRILAKILNRFSKHILHKEVIFNINWFYYNRKWLMKEKIGTLAIKYGEEPKPKKIDDIDRGIMKMLVKDARATIVDIAKATEQSPQNIINRKKKLEAEKIITKYSLNLNYKKIGYVFCKTFIYLQNVTEERLGQLYRHCAAQPNIFALTTTLGAWDLELEFEAEDFEQMTEIMDGIRMKFSDIIKNYESVIITKQSEAKYIWE